MNTTKKMKTFKFFNELKKGLTTNMAALEAQQLMNKSKVPASSKKN
jgi:hypothetical protein